MNVELIVQVVLPILGLIISYVIIPLIKAKLTKEQLDILETKYDQVKDWIEKAVLAAEQMEKAGLITIPKKEFVTSFLLDKLREFEVDLTVSELDLLIEAEVKELNIKQGK